MTALRVATVGAGYFSRFHHEGWAAIDEVQHIGACDRDIGRAMATGVAAFDDLGTMLRLTTPDLLDIILPPAAHRTALETAFSHGVGTVICQKPFCRDLREAREMVAAADAAGALLVVHENVRFQPWYRRLKQLLDDGLLGEVQQMTFRLRPGDGQGPDAYLDRQPYFRTMDRLLVHETAVHWIDTFRFLFGDPVAVYADLRQVNPAIAGEDAGTILFDHPGGVRTLFDGNRSLDHAAANTRCTMGEALVEGTRGTITLRGDGSLWFRRFGEMVESSVMEARDWKGFGGDCAAALEAHVVAALREGRPPENTAREYLRVIEIEEAVYRSAGAGQKIALAL